MENEGGLNILFRKMLHFASIADALEHLVCNTANNYLLS